ncbi:MAG: glycoside hydrolase family 57 protein [Bacillota bacterium]
MTSGYLSMILHAHLPYVKNTKSEDSLEERWLFQAITECYIPLLNGFYSLLEENVKFRLAVSLSPPLLEMLADPLLQAKYKTHLENLLELSEKEVKRTSYDSRVQLLARMYRDRFHELLSDYTDKYKQDLIEPWRVLETEGRVELMATAATHGYLPLLLHNEAVVAQIKAGVAAFRKHFHHEPKGFWLPECAYAPEIEEPLKNENLAYFVTETHGLLFATPRPRFGYHAPIVTPNGLLAFARDPDCSKQVWSAQEGYPGDGVYREYYRDIGYELPEDYLGNALPGRTRVPTGIKYYRVTDRRSDHKQIYEPGQALARAWEHAGNFVFWRNKEAGHWSGVLGRNPIMVAPYDAELFGHWWYEGPVWLAHVFRRLSQEASQVTAITPWEYVQHYPVNQVSQPATSSWGYKGYHEVWLEGSNHWVYRHLHEAQERLARISRANPNARGLQRRALSQAVRELLLAQSSDWPFIMKTGTLPDYAKDRFVTHIGRFQKLCDEIEQGAPDPGHLLHLEKVDSVFWDIDLAGLYAASSTQVP